MASTSSRQPTQPALADLETALCSCTACALSETRTRVVFGVGNPDAQLMFVGEAPGFNEDQQGEPFVGQAGRLLTELLAGIGLDRSDVYIANVLKCRPPGNRDPLPPEIEECKPNLYEQIRLIRPRVICTLGRFATRLLAETQASMAAVRGRAKEMEVGGVPVIVFPVFHPAAALYTPSNKVVLQEDFRKLRRLLDLGSRALLATEGAAEGAPPSDGEAAGSGGTAGEDLDGDSPQEPRSSATQLPLW